MAALMPTAATLFVGLDRFQSDMCKKMIEAICTDDYNLANPNITAVCEAYDEEILQYNKVAKIL